MGAMLQHETHTPVRPRPPLSPASVFPRPRALLVAAVLYAVGVGIGVWAVSTGARATGELRLDETLAGDRGPALADVSRVINVVFAPGVGLIWLALICVILWRTLGRVVALRAALLTLGGWLSIEIFKLLFHRHRPPTGLVHALVVERQPDSFPSGHTAFTASVVAGLFLAVAGHHVLRRVILSVGLPLIVIVAASRLFIGAHYLVDVSAAPLLAWASIAVGVALGFADGPTFLPGWLHGLVIRRPQG